MIIKDLGAVSAYAYAVEKGYTGTEEEFATLMASYATVAEEAAESAESASTSATSASASAQTATTKASEASTSATQASASATSASQSASTATTKASEASASASTASTKAGEASTSATTASTKASEASASATSAQTAQGLAESARDDAIDAKTDAETARDLAQQYAESIDPQKLIGAYPVDTATGAIASFSDGADNIPMKSVKIRIDPVQDLHGYDSPWPAGGGDNKFDESVFSDYGGVLQSSGVWHFNSLVNFLNKTLWTAPTGIGQISVTLWRKQSNTTSKGVRLKINYTDDTFSLIGDENGTGGTDVYTETSNAGKTVRDISGDYGVNQLSSDINVVVCLGATPATTYAPYSNICPISGWTGAQVNHSGADTSNPTTYPITFPVEAGTVYGGELDVTNGTLTVDRAMMDLGTLNYALSSHAAFGQYFYADVYRLGIRRAGNYSSITYPSICSAFKCVSRNANVFVNGTYSFDGDTERVTQVQFKDNAYSDATEFQTAMNGVQLVYELATPTTYHLTPTEIKSLLGDNNVWADAGDSTVEYRADTAKYIDKKIAEAVNALS